jgi:hypothetical protein
MTHMMAPLRNAATREPWVGATRQRVSPHGSNAITDPRYRNLSAQTRFVK